MKKRLKEFYRGWLRPIALMLLVIAPLRSAVLDWNWIPSGSMKPTLFEGDLVLINKLAYDLKVPFTTIHIKQWDDPHRGDIVVLFAPDTGTRLVKRVVGIPGDVIELKHEQLVINGQPAGYRGEAVIPYRMDIHEDSNPLLVRENLAGKDHFVLVLPHRPAMRSFGPIRVPLGTYFVMGDSRDNSHDSRFFGTVSRDQIIGRVPGVILSFSLNRYLAPRFSRFCTDPDGI